MFSSFSFNLFGAAPESEPTKEPLVEYKSGSDDDVQERIGDDLMILNEHDDEMQMDFETEPDESGGE